MIQRIHSCNYSIFLQSLFFPLNYDKMFPPNGWGKKGPTSILLPALDSSRPAARLSERCQMLNSSPYAI